MPFQMPVPESQPVDLFSELRRLAADADRGDWPAVAAFLGSLRGLDDVAVACGQVEERLSEQVLQRVPVSDPTGALAQTVRAVGIVLRGWNIRGTGWARSVTAQQWAGFHEHLNRAEQLLIEVTARQPEQGYAWVERMIICRGISLGHDEARRRFDRLSLHHPHTYIGGFQLVQQLLPKWGGSWEKVDGFGAELLRTVPAGSLGLLPVLAGHLERFTDAGSDAEGAAYLRSPAVSAQIHQVADRTVRHPGFQGGYRHYTAHDYFAMLFSLMGDHAAAAPHFRALAGRRTPFWNWYFDNPGTAYANLRDRALARG
ncbi:hypothetical protein OHA72_55995 [Dactylosporangium sp. NBC_01737]|uniref:hypothetical protein n=1 Tax=Dactylosporangium sp. NBC_01737 TaxID=2975959 RepID=UPI002E13CB6B|nr:hypothetical protein OHA72_55995 [Dactylosporangium sp. NBC_01737]